MMSAAAVETRTRKASVTVVIPVFNSQDCLDALAAALEDALGNSERDYDVIFINDGSGDDSWRVVCGIAAARHGFSGVNLRKNVGQDNAIMAGLALATGEVVVIMDDDLQHDPAEIEKLVAAVDAGHDVCYAHFSALEEAWWKRAGSWLNGMVGESVLNKPKHLYLSPFKAVARSVVHEIIKYDGPYPYIDGLILRSTSNIIEVPATHHQRAAGRGNFNLARSLSIWLRHATGFSLLPLRIATVMGFGFSLLGFTLALYFLAEKLAGIGSPSGWASLTVATLVIGGVQLLCLGMIGEYVGRVFLHLSRRPQYVIGEIVGDNTRLSKR